MSHYGQYTYGNALPPQSQDPYFQNSQTVVIQQGHPYSARSTVVVQYGQPRSPFRNKYCAVFGAILLTVAVGLVFFGILVLTGVIPSNRDATNLYDDAWDGYQSAQNNHFSGFLSEQKNHLNRFQSEARKHIDGYHRIVAFMLLSVGGFLLVAGLAIFIPACRHQRRQALNNQRRQRNAENQPSTGFESIHPQPRSHQPNQPNFQSPCPPPYQQASVYPSQPLQLGWSNQEGSAIPLQPIPPSMNPHSYSWASPDPYPNADVTSCENSELGCTNAN